MKGVRTLFFAELRSGESEVGRGGSDGRQRRRGPANGQAVAARRRTGSCDRRMAQEGARSPLVSWGCGGLGFGSVLWFS